MSEKKQFFKKPIHLVLLIFFLTLAFVSLTFFISSIFSRTFSYQFHELTSKENSIKRAYISGAVQKPGVYLINDRMIIIDLIEVAGGFVEEVDLEQVNKTINLSERVYNEDHVFIPFQGQNLIGSLPLENNTQNPLVNINTATSGELETLPGIGPSTASKIIEGRPYKNIEEIKNIKGIGDATFEKFANQITVF